MRALLLMPFLFWSTLNAQTTFAPIGPTWSYTQDVQWNADSTVFTITAVGDTLINGASCSVLDFSGGISACMGYRRFVTTRGDSVLFWEPIDSTFRTLYVFGLSPGEGWQTLVGGGYFDDGGWVTVLDTLSFLVTSSDMVEINGLSLRRSTVQAIWSPFTGGQNMPISGTITERLGHSGFLFPWIDGACDFEFNGPLRCYADPDITWMNPQFPQCDLGVGVEEHDGAQIAIQPTVVRQGETILVSSPAGTVEVFDASGRAVSSSTTSGKLSLTLHRSGSYVLRLTSERGERSVERVFVH